MNRLEGRKAEFLTAAKACRQSVEDAFPPKWFYKQEATPPSSKGSQSGIAWKYKGGYWEARSTRKFGPSLDPFGTTTIPPNLEMFKSG